MARQFANCLSALTSIKMWDKFKACLILASGGRAQTQTICLRGITQCTERGKGERYNRHHGRQTQLIRGVERLRKKTCGVPENSVTVIRLSHLRGNSHRPHSQRDKGTFKHHEALNDTDWWDAWGQRIDSIDREAQIEARWQKVLIWQRSDQEVCVWSPSLSMTHMFGCLGRTSTRRSGSRRSSVISGSRLCFLIADTAAISWLWKKPNWLKSYAPSKVLPASADRVECLKRNAILKIQATDYFLSVI